MCLLYFVTALHQSYDISRCLMHIAYRRLALLHPRNTLPHLTTGQLGCFMSHFTIWHYMASGTESFSTRSQAYAHLSYCRCELRKQAQNEDLQYPVRPAPLDSSLFKNTRWFWSRSSTTSLQLSFWRMILICTTARVRLDASGRKGCDMHWIVSFPLIEGQMRLILDFAHVLEREWGVENHVWTHLYPNLCIRIRTCQDQIGTKMVLPFV